jgi:hypothetical protein
MTLSVTAIGSSLHYQWKKDGDNIGTDSPTYVASAAGVYTVVVTGVCGSATSDPATVTVNANPAAPTITPLSSTAFCPGGNVILRSSYASGNIWNTTAATQDITVADAGSYTVVYTDANGCSATSLPLTVTVYPKPTLLVNSSPYVISSNEAFSYDAQSAVIGTSFTWVRPEVTGITASLASSGTGSIVSDVLVNNPNTNPIDVSYIYTLSANGCVNNDTVVVTVENVLARIVTTAPTVTTTSTPDPDFDVKAIPTTTTTNFNLIIQGKSTLPVSVFVYDAFGTIVERKQNIPAGSTLRFGDGWSAGMFLVEVIQGDRRKVVKVIKTN